MNGTSLATIATLGNDNEYALYRLKEERIFVSTDGPFESVIKFKPPMCFSIEDAELVAEKIDHILTGK